MGWDILASKERIDTVMKALIVNGISAEFVETGEEAKRKALGMIPEKAEVMTMTSVTLDTIGLAKEISESGRYDSVKAKLAKMDRATQGGEMQKLGAAPDWAIGSAHAVTENGEVIIASNTGSQLPAYAYGSQHVIWVVGAQKIVATKDEAMKRIYEHVLPLESERAKKAYGVPGSNVSKMLVINKEVTPNRITMIIVGESLGF